MLLGPRAILQHRPGEVLRPRRHGVEEERLLDVHERRHPVAGERYPPLRQTVHLAGDLVHGEHHLVAHVLRQRIVLVLAHERRLVLELQIHGVLQG